MTRPVYSQVLIEQRALNGSFTFIVGSGYVCVIRDIAANHPSSSAAGALLLYDQDVEAVYFYAAGASGVQSYVHQECRIMQGAESTIVVQTGCPWDVKVCGYLLTE